MDGCSVLFNVQCLLLYLAAEDRRLQDRLKAIKAKLENRLTKMKSFFGSSYSTFDLMRLHMWSFKLCVEDVLKQMILCQLSLHQTGTTESSMLQLQKNELSNPTVCKQIKVRSVRNRRTMLIIIRHGDAAEKLISPHNQVSQKERMSNNETVHSHSE